MKDGNVTVNFSLKTVLWVLGTILALWLVITLREVIILFLLSFIFAAAIDPAVDKLEKKKLPRTAAIALIYILVLAFLILIIKTIIPPLVSQISSLAAHKEAYIDKIASYFPTLSAETKDILKGTSLGLIDSTLKAPSLGLLSKAAGVFTGVLGLIVVFFVSFYLLLERNGIEKTISSYVPEKYQSRTLSVSKKITAKMSSWFRGQMLLCFTIFLADYIVLSVLKVDFALMLAILAGFLEILPIAGPIISGVLAALVALTVSPVLSAVVIIYFFLIQQLENHVLVPQIMKKTLGLHPIAIIFALLAGGKILGILGIIIAVPVAAALSVLFNEFYKYNRGGKSGN